ncbi:DUF58 domain-containing protein [Myxococcus sp. AB025B]|uniref:DUF58 domain-containing protein n=1 Tax=Myxococcus sp. AB025B TaxID=2562794 RepID=UPI001143178D|nr:DUF58 domain-containing protein [Myxococcus sp. AB025B]
MKSTWKQRWARLRARLRPPRTLRVTRIGRTYLVVTFGVGLGALNTGNNLLYLLLGLLLSMVVVSGVLSERCIRDLSVRRVGTDAAFAGQPFAFRWAVSRKQGQAFALALAEADSPLSGAGGVGYLPSGVEHIVRADLVAPRRGPVRLTGVQVTTTWPLGLFAKTRVLALDGLLLVYPKRGYACMDPGDAERGPVGDAGNPRRNDGSGDVTGLRELAEGEDARRIHWLKSASMGKLLRVEREREERRTWMLSIEPGLEGEVLERRCEEVAALAHRLLEEGHEVGLHTAEERLRAGTGAAQERRILRALAWLGFERPRDEEAAA